MEIIVEIVDGVAAIYQEIPPGTYQIEIIELPGYVEVLYNEELVVTSTITLEPEKPAVEFYVEAVGVATVVLMGVLPDGTYVELKSDEVKGIRVYRCDEEGKHFEGYIEMTDYKGIYQNLPYHYDQIKEVADGPTVYLGLDRETLPSRYQPLEGTDVVGMKLKSQLASENVFTFYLVIGAVNFQVCQCDSGIYANIDDDGEPLGYLGVSGTLTLGEIS